MKWTHELARGIKDALHRGGQRRVAVHSETQIEPGKHAAAKLGGKNADNISFELIPEGQREQYPVGTLLGS